MLALEIVNDLVEELIAYLDAHADEPSLIRAAMAHLNLTMIHPFRDGNGRASRLLLVLECYHAGIEVGRYISLERLIEQNKDRYYETLKLSSQGWNEGQHNPWHYINFLLYTLLDAYKEFERRVGDAQAPRGEKQGLVVIAIDRATGSFSVADLQRECPGVSLDTIRHVLKRLRDEGRVQCLGRGRNAVWKRTSE